MYIWAIGEPIIEEPARSLAEHLGNVDLFLSLQANLSEEDFHYKVNHDHHELWYRSDVGIALVFIDNNEMIPERIVHRCVCRSAIGIGAILVARAGTKPAEEYEVKVGQAFKQIILVDEDIDADTIWTKVREAADEL